MKVVAESGCPLAIELFSEPPFSLKLVEEITPCVIQGADILICRSHTHVDKLLLKGSSLKCVASATSGLDHIDQSLLKRKQIHLVDAKGANAQSVCDYLIAVLASIDKSFKGGKAGVIGVGNVGSKVYNALQQLEIEVLASDPPRGRKESTFQHFDIDQLTDCDVITVHTPLSFDAPDSTYQLIDETFIKRLKPGTVLINTSRGEVLDDNAILSHGKHLTLCLDVFANEPTPNLELIQQCHIATPHIAGHAIEAKLRASVMLYHKICDLFSTQKTVAKYDHLLSVSDTKICLDQVRLNYSPLEETVLFKKIRNADDFKALRAKHNYRHELMARHPRVTP